MLSELSAHTVDEKGNRTFVTGKNLKRIIKFATLKGFSLYFDPEATFWVSKTPWRSMRHEEWDFHFLTPIRQSLEPDRLIAHPDSFLLKPVEGHLK